MSNEVFFTYEIYESNVKTSGYSLYNKGEIELESVEEAKAEVEHYLPARIYARNWTEGENGCHVIIQQDSLNQALVFLKPIDAPEPPAIINAFDAGYFRKAILKDTTQEGIACKMNLKQQHISRYLQRGDQIKVETLIEICNAANVDVRLLFNRNQPMPPV